jgi:predicted nucleotide-binding protein
MFIASSVKGLDIAYAVQEELEHDLECTVWSQGVFTPSAYPVDAIIKELDRSDFGAFVFAPEDAVIIKDTWFKAVRDNVLFELGLFMGRRGRSLFSPGRQQPFGCRLTWRV